METYGKKWKLWHNDYFWPQCHTLIIFFKVANLQCAHKLQSWINQLWVVSWFMTWQNQQSDTDQTELMPPLICVSIWRFKWTSNICFARRWVGLQTLWLFRLKDLSIDEMVGAWCFGCLSGPPGFTCWISFALLFSFIYCGVLIFALSPCYILFYMF